MIYGNTEGIREAQLAELERLVDAQFERDMYMPDRLLNALVRLTEAIRRDILLYLGRDGTVLEVAVGAEGSVALPEMHLRRNPDRLSGFRCIHTDPSGAARFTQSDLQALRTLRFDSLCRVGVSQGRATGISAAFLGEAEYGELSTVEAGPVKPGRVPQEKWLREIDAAEERVARAIAQGGVTREAEKAVLLSIEGEDSLEELAALADTAGALVVKRAVQKRAKPDPGMYIGSGKAEELALECRALDTDVVIVDDELTGAQAQNLEKALEVRVIDRTQLILDIFASRARSAEGKLQVELAQLRYMLPRLAGQGASLSRLGGGIGTRGPGETRLETDRRHIRRRIDDLAEQIGVLARQRKQHRERRRREERRIVSLVGYTNAGKSTLLNALTGADVFAEDKLFATLDPTSRALELPDGTECTLVDTVGFIRKLPHQLVDAFRSTLEEILESDLIAVVTDVSNYAFTQQRDTVFRVLNELGASLIPVIEVFNKIDVSAPDFAYMPGTAVAVSARTGEGLDELRAAVAAKLSQGMQCYRVTVPYRAGAALSFAHEKGRVKKEEYTDEGTELEVVLSDADWARLKGMIERLQ